MLALSEYIYIWLCECNNEYRDRLRLQTVAFAQYVAKKVSKKMRKSWHIRDYSIQRTIADTHTHTSKHTNGIFILAVHSYRCSTASISIVPAHVCVKKRNTVAPCVEHSSTHISVYERVSEFYENNDTEVSGNVQRGFKFGVTINSVWRSIAVRTLCDPQRNAWPMLAVFTLVEAGDVYHIQLF